MWTLVEDVSHVDTGQAKRIAQEEVGRFGRRELQVHRLLKPLLLRSDFYFFIFFGHIDSILKLDRLIHRCTPKLEW